MTAPGWYPDGQGQVRYWDGQGWTAHAQPGPPPVPVAKGHRKWPWIVLATVVVCAVVAVAVAAGVKNDGNDATDQQNAATTSLGSVITVSQDEGSADLTVSNLQPATASEFAGDPEGDLYSVDVSAVGTSGSFDVNPLYFTARTSSGLVIDCDLGGTDDQIASDPVTSGDRLTGTVSFDVPSGETIEQVRFNNPIGGTLATWTT